MIFYVIELCLTLWSPATSIYNTMYADYKSNSSGQFYSDFYQGSVSYLFDFEYSMVTVIFCFVIIFQYF